MKLINRLKRITAGFLLAQMLFALVPAPVAFAANFWVDQDPTNEPVLIVQNNATLKGSLLTGGCSAENFSTTIDGNSYVVNISSKVNNPNGNGCIRNWELSLRDNVRDGVYDFTIIYSGNLTVYYPNAIRVERSEDSKIRICQFTSDRSENTYVSIKVNKSSLINGSGHGNQDIVPPFTGMPSGVNWSVANEDIWENDCQIPAPKYTITFVTNGGTSVAPIIVEEGKTIVEAPTTTRMGYSFQGWFKEASLTNLWKFSTDVVSSNVTLYAKWLDVDQDNDGHLDNADNCPMTANTDQADRDGDGVGDACDNCIAVVNRNQADSNANGTGDACEIVPEVDAEAPDVAIVNPANESVVSGMVEIRGTVTDANPHHYWFVVQGPNGTTNLPLSGTGVVNETQSFTNRLLTNWDTKLYPNGQYVIKLEARDSAGNKDAGSSDWHVVTVNNPLHMEMNGEADITLEYGSSYVDEGASCLYGETPVTPTDDSANVDTMKLGDYVVTYSCTVAEKNVTVKRNVHVIPRNLKITANSLSKVVGVIDPNLTYEVEGSLIGTDALTGSLARESGETVGEYDILIGTLSAGANYKITFVPGLFVVNAAPVVVVDTPVAPVVAEVAAPTRGVLGRTQPAEEAEVASDVSGEKEVKGVEDKEDEEDPTCPWWWIVSIALALALAYAGLSLKSAREDSFLRRYYYAWPVALGALGWLLHYYLHKGYKATWFCDNFWLITLVLVAVAEVAYKKMLSPQKEEEKSLKGKINK